MTCEGLPAHLGRPGRRFRGYDVAPRADDAPRPTCEYFLPQHPPCCGAGPACLLVRIFAGGCSSEARASSLPTADDAAWSAKGTIGASVTPDLPVGATSANPLRGTGSPGQGSQGSLQGVLQHNVEASEPSRSPAAVQTRARRRRAAHVHSHRGRRHRRHLAVHRLRVRPPRRDPGASVRATHRRPPPRAGAAARISMSGTEAISTSAVRATRWRQDRRLPIQRNGPVRRRRPAPYAPPTRTAQSPR